MIWLAAAVYLAFGVTTALVFLHAAGKSQTFVEGKHAAVVITVLFWPYVLFGVWLANWLDS
jgi:hypothetical protein